MLRYDLYSYFLYEGNAWYCLRVNNSAIYIDSGRIGKGYKIIRLIVADLDKSGLLKKLKLIYCGKDLKTYELQISQLISQDVYDSIGNLFKIKKKPSELISHIHDSCNNWNKGPVKKENCYIHLGHRNFAHFIWNELPSVIEFNKISDLNLPLVIVKNPLGKFEWGHRFVESITDLSSSNVPLKIGGTLVTSDSMKFLNSILEKNNKKDNKIYNRLLWLSIRTSARCPSNNHEFLSAVAQFWLDEYGDVMLDGFTPIASGAILKHGARKKETDILVAKIKDSINLRSCQNNLYSTSEMSLDEALYHTKFASFYISPLGTIQHKIAWLRNVPGILHCGIFRGRQRQPYWHANQVENGLLPGLLPEESVFNVGDSLESERNHIYYVDVEIALKYIKNFVVLSSI